VKSGQYVAPPEQLRPLDSNDPEAIASARGFLGQDDQDKGKGIWELAFRLAQYEVPEGSEAYTRWKYLLIADLIRVRLAAPRARKFKRGITWAVKKLREVQPKLARWGFTVSGRTIWNAWADDTVKRVMTTPRVRAAWLANWLRPPTPRKAGTRQKVIGTHDCSSVGRGERTDGEAILKENDPGVVHCLACGFKRRLADREIRRYYDQIIKTEDDLIEHARWRGLDEVTATEVSPLQ
jgi:hypothetical protein